MRELEPAPIMPDFTHVETWIFDLDNTLYPSDSNLFAQIDVRMTDFVAAELDLDREEARRLQKKYYVDYGTTLNGLMKRHDVKPDAFLDYVHDIDVSAVAPNAALAERISALPGRRYVFTNGSAKHAENVMTRLGVTTLFDDVFDIAAADFQPKPYREAYEKFLTDHGVAGRSAAMFEDIAVNLEVPHALGMTTVLVQSDALWIADEPDAKRPARTTDSHPHVHYAVNCLTSFLGRLRHADTPQDPNS